MPNPWQELTKLTGGRPLVVERVRLADTDIHIEGAFEPPPLASLTYEDQVFVAAFVKVHGHIKRMEGLFGVSYPTIKNRLNRIAAALDFVEIDTSAPTADVLSRVERGELTVDEALKLLGAEDGAT